MMLVGAYLGFIYWDKHHRGRRRGTSQEGVEACQEPPSFPEFMKDMLTLKDDPPPEGAGKDAANTLIAELSGIFEPTVDSSSDDLTSTLSWSSSGLTSVSEQQSDSEYDHEYLEENEDYSPQPPIRLAEGLEYEPEPEEEEEENITNNCNIPSPKTSRPVSAIAPSRTRAMVWAPQIRIA